MFIGPLPCTSTALFLFFACKAGDKIFFTTSIFFVIFLYTYLTNNIFILQVTVLGHEPSSMNLLLKRMCEVMTAKKGCNSLWIIELSTFYYNHFQPFFFIKL